MNKIWLGILIMSLTLLTFTHPEQVLISMMNSSSKAVSLSIKLLGVYAVWLGIIEIVKETKLSQKLSTFLSPIIDAIFGKIDDKAKEYISMNLSFNMLGVGNAATPTALKATKILDDNSGNATFPAIMLLVLNATSLQILPTTILGIKTASMSINPSSIILPTLLASTISTLLGIFLVKICFDYSYYQY